MKNLLRIMIILSIILVVFFYVDTSINENDTLEAPRTVDPLPLPEINESPLDVERPSEGLSTYIGKSTEKWLEDYGMPERIEPSAFGYEWWVYNQSFANFIMVGTTEGEVVQVYTAGTASNTAPYTIGQTLDELYRFTIIENEVTVKYGTNTYTFNLGPEDVSSRILVGFEDVFAQLYVDEEDKVLEAVRFTDAETLIRHQPYDMMYSGELLPKVTPSSSLQQAIDEANARQIIDLTNVYRLHHQRKPLAVNQGANVLAKEHSQLMARQNFSSGEELEVKALDQRLTDAQISFEAAAQNTATQYYDAAEAVHGWINSPDHRKTLLSRDYNQIGVGVFGKYYTQSFLKQEPTAAEQR
ncbi:CAP domain-containing protein [Planococcus salinus]|uniref:CAP domain-containing protein n=1 Tax=Planococcus salinus TaxID=1848460 RepID=A0A3M8PBJ6_9BACL|nr:CAP-associated domain-containing protein [Planococcus salinus]RNF40701.1 hypothetical protein EEX84_04565 [Planococcus salinus]